MRCPKCGYISFDHIKNCLKCKKDISGKVDVVGTTYHATAPSFLKAGLTNMSEESDGFIENESEQIGGEIGFSDPDLDVLSDESEDFSFDDEDDENSISFDNSDSDDVEAEFHLEDDEADKDFEDEGGFEFELEDDEEQFDEQLTAADVDVSPKLPDTNDLVPPTIESDEAPAPAETSEMSLSLDDDINFDDDLELDGLDLNLGLGGDEEIDNSELSLSLDDIDLSEDDLMSGDDEFDSLNMDLDLAGLDDKEVKPKEKMVSGSLDDISLSLD